MILKIYSLNDTEQLNIIASLGIGEHIIGRGLLNITDLRVSKKHAVIKVSPEIVTLTAIHTNPCFFKKSNDKRLQIIRKDSTHELTDGDTFGLLPTDCWFTVGIQRGKRLNDENPENLETKKAKLNSSEASTSGINEQSTKTIEEFNIEVTNVRSLVEVKTENSDEVKPEIHEAEASNGVEVKQEAAEAETEVKIEIEPFDLPTTSAGASSATPAALNGVKREKCWYAADCFRKNPNHRSQFSHPGDADYDSDPDEVRPDCPYGANCYRRNPEHRREYRHGATKPAPKPINGQVRKRQKKPPQTATEDDDDYDFDDPFINDASSDDYQPSSGIDSSDTDELDEESQELRRKKFTK